MIETDKDKLIEATEKEKRVQDLHDFNFMVNTEGWRKLKKWIDAEISYLNQSIYHCKIEEVESFRSEARGMQNILNKIDKTIANKSYEEV